MIITILVPELARQQRWDNTTLVFNLPEIVFV